MLDIVANMKGFNPIKESPQVVSIIDGVLQLIFVLGVVWRRRIDNTEVFTSLLLLTTVPRQGHFQRGCRHQAERAEIHCRSDSGGTGFWIVFFALVVLPLLLILLSLNRRRILHFSSFKIIPPFTRGWPFTATILGLGWAEGYGTRLVVTVNGVRWCQIGSFGPSFQCLNDTKINATKKTRVSNDVGWVGLTLGAI